MIKVNHELPACLLKESYTINDYEFVLPHLLDEDEEYRNHFMEAKQKGRYIIMDNSLHELGKAYQKDRLLYWVETLKPDEFIIPDVWENRDRSIVSAKEWAGIILPPETVRIAVVQATSLLEAMTCTQIYQDLGYRKIAFSYGSSYYNEMVPHPNKNLGKALGRLYIISSLYDKKILTPKDRVHLLGTAVPQEFGWYKGIECIRSLDTSNPVMAALDGTKYTTSGLNEKPKANLNSHFHVNKDEVDIKLVKYNVEMFRKINNL